MESWCEYAMAVLMEGNFISVPQKFSAFNFGNWDFQGDSVAGFTLKVIFSHTCLGILDKRYGSTRTGAQIISILCMNSDS